MTYPVIDTTFTSGTTITSNWLNGVNDYVNEKNPSDHSAATITYESEGIGAVQTTVQSKLQETISILDFGADPTGVADSTTAITNALAASKHVLVPIGSYLISSTITVPENSKLEFQGGLGNTSTNEPAAYFIKKSTMTTVGIKVSSCAIISGGGLVCQTGNTGDGVQIVGNSGKLENFYVCKAGGVGVRVGTDGTYANTNCFELYHVNSYNNGSHGFYIHDGVSVGGADCNAGTLYQCIANYNAGDGFKLGHCFWVSVINCLAEVNTGYGIHLSGTNNATYPECRWAYVAGGDFNEGNVAGQLYDQSYFSQFNNPDPNNVPTNAGNGLQGSGLRTNLTAYQSTFQTLATAGAYQSTLFLNSSDSYNTNVARPLIIKGNNLNSNNKGTGIAFKIYNTDFHDAVYLTALQNSGTQDGFNFAVNDAGTMVSAFNCNTNAKYIAPGSDNTWASGYGSFRWSVIYSATGTINTSDENEKQQIRELLDVEKSVAIKCKSLLRAFKFNDSVEYKGDNARIHFGIIAQDVKNAFESEGLNAEDYGIFCSDTWTDETTNQEVTRLGIRYDELFAFIIAAL